MDLKDFCVEELSKYSKRYKAGEISVWASCASCFYTFGYYDRAGHFEYLALTTDDTNGSGLSFYSIYFKYFHPNIKIKNHPIGHYKVYKSYFDYKEAAELEDFYSSLCYAIDNGYDPEEPKYELDYNKHMLLKEVYPFLDRGLYRHLEGQRSKQSERVKNLAKRVPSEAKRNNGRVFISRSYFSSNKQITKAEMKRGELFDSGKLRLKSHNLELVKKYLNGDKRFNIFDVAKSAYIIGFIDRALEAEDLKIKEFDCDEPFNEYMDVIKNLFQ